jgi:hypothetical protein
MRLIRGKLTRRLPRTEARPEDVTVVKTCHCDGMADEYFVAPADLGGAYDAIPRLTHTFRLRRQAVSAAWEILARTGGRLLDYQRGTLAEQPYLWRVVLRRELISKEEWPTFLRRKPGEQKLIAALVAWSGLPMVDARTLARLLIARGEVEYPLTQTETRQAQRPFEATRPAVYSSWSRVVVSPAEVVPAALMADGVPRLLREMHEACNLYQQTAGT